jgi:glycerophosphoryl diester phosphodiesterase
LDAKLTRDEQVVVIHDPTVDRTCDGSGLVRHMNITEIRNFDAGKKFNAKFKGEKIPFLSEVFELLGKAVLINVELTNYADPKDQLPEKVAELVKKHDIEKQILFSSFHPGSLSRIHRLLPKIPIALLALPGLAGMFYRTFLFRKLSPEVIHPFYSDVKEAYVKREKKWGRKINVWTVDDEKEMERLMRLGVNGIITNDIPLALSVRKKAE